MILSPTYLIAQMSAQSASLSQTQPSQTSSGVTVTMNMTVKDIMKALEGTLPPLESSAERRAKYVPNIDAASLGYGIHHRDHSRYLASSDADRMPTAAQLLQQRAKVTAPAVSFAATAPAATAPAAARPGAGSNSFDTTGNPAAARLASGEDVMSAGNIGASVNASVRLHISVPGTEFGAARRSTGNKDKPTQYDEKGRIIYAPAGLGYGTHDFRLI